jgi:hypothetical protein
MITDMEYRTHENGRRQDEEGKTLEPLVSLLSRRGLTYINGSLRRTLVVNKTLHKARQRYYELNLTRSYTEKR